MTSSPLWRLALAGECMVTRPFAMHDDERFQRMLGWLRDADVTYAHLETNIARLDEIDWPAMGAKEGTYFLSDPQVAADLRWSGIDLMSLANNHTYDYGAAGVLATMRHMDRVGIAHAGTGRDLEEAREPAYLETRKGRVALVAMSSGNRGHEWAGLPKATIRGRPGVNPLRLVTQYEVDAQAAGELRRIGEGLGGSVRLSMPADQLSATGTGWIEGDQFAIHMRADPADVTANLRSIEVAATMADLVIVAHHYSASEARRGDEPPGFVRELARSCIDAGADVYVGHGWHKTLGIEIYRGRPMIYGIGNFFAQSEFVQRVPSDGYEKFGHDMDRLPTLRPTMDPLQSSQISRGKDADTWWSSAVIACEYSERGLCSLELRPVEMGRGAPDPAVVQRKTGHGHKVLTEGRPVAAEGAEAEMTLRRLQKLSAGYGTQIDIEGDVGRVAL